MLSMNHTIARKDIANFMITQTSYSASLAFIHTNVLGQEALKWMRFDLDPMDEGCSNIQSIILRDSWCVGPAIRSLIGACKALRKFIYTHDFQKKYLGD